MYNRYLQSDHGDYRPIPPPPPPGAGEPPLREERDLLHRLLGRLKIGDLDTGDLLLLALLVLLFYEGGDEELLLALALAFLL